MRVLIATDAWHPQVNGVVRTFERIAERAEDFGATLDFLTPDRFPGIPMPGYPEIRLAFTGARAVRRHIDRLQPDHIHIATEGPIGLAARRVCLNAGRPFTTSYHTRFPEYLRARAPVPVSLSYAYLRRFHNAGQGTLVATASLIKELEGHGFRNLHLWTRGVDSDLFRPRAESVLDLPRPIFLSVGRVAVEKNIEAFLSLDLPGSKVVVGEGPARASLEKRFPDVHFLGQHTGEDLAQLYSSADVFVFPSRTDTFGIVILEALASGLPVAAYPVTGPLDVIGDSGAGALDENLGVAAMRALACSREEARALALTHSWSECARIFFAQIGSVYALPTPRGQRRAQVKHAQAK